MSDRSYLKEVIGSSKASNTLGRTIIRGLGGSRRLDLPGVCVLISVFLAPCAKKGFPLNPQAYGSRSGILKGMRGYAKEKAKAPPMQMQSCLFFGWLIPVLWISNVSIC